MNRISSSWIIDPITGAVRADPNQPTRRRVGIVPQHRQRGTGNASARKFLGVYARPEDAALIDAEAAARGMSRSAFLIMAALAHCHPGRRLPNASTKTEAGLDDLRRTLATIIDELPPRATTGVFNGQGAYSQGSQTEDPAPPDPDPARASLVKP